MIRTYKKSYKKGDVLLTEEPFAFVLQGKLNTERCDYCFKRTEVLKCLGCSFAHYCDRTCQKNAWSYHKFECSNIKRVAPQIVPDAARMLARIIIKLNKNGAHEKYYYTQTNFRMFKDLMSHYNDIKKDDKRLEHFISLIAVLYDFLKDQIIPNEVELLAIYGKMIINSFSILDSDSQTIGTGLYLGASIIDHSCTPNAVAVFNGKTIFIRTLQDIDTLDWIKVRISYIELLNLPSDRQKELQYLYYFLCECERCLDDEELNLMTSVLCQNQDCKTTIKGGLLEGTHKCPKCESIISEETRTEMKEIVEFTEEQLKAMSHSAYLDICRVCLKTQEKFFSPFNVYKLKILYLAMDGCIQLNNWESAYDYGKQLVEPFQKYYGDAHPGRGIFLLMMGKISGLLNRIDEAKKYYKEAAPILLVTHGSQHPLVKEELLKNMELCLS